MMIYGLNINALLFIVLIFIFFTTLSLTFAIKNNRSSYIESIDDLNRSLMQIKNKVISIDKENELYRNENHQINNRIILLEDEYERKYKEQTRLMEEQGKIELERLKIAYEKNIENFSITSHEMWEHFAESFAKKIVAANLAKGGNNNK